MRNKGLNKEVKAQQAIRRETLRKLVELSDAYPDLRIYQLLGNITPVGDAQDNYYVEDTVLLERLRRYPDSIAAPLGGQQSGEDFEARGGGQP